MIVGTAGHIDHGKTTLVKALTGVDTDRLAEEKRRGMTIELGFAQMRSETVSKHNSTESLEALSVSFIDVPGHEKMVRTMLAGSSGIDFSMILVAADDGVMPQTLEHLSILNSLRIPKGCFVITKIDQVDATVLEQRRQEVSALKAQFDMEAFALLSVSAHTGQGIEELAAHLCKASLMHEQSRDRELSLMDFRMGFRMGLDRVFTLDGIGTVVAGSIQAGVVRVGDSLCLAHDCKNTYRVRSLQVHGQSVDSARFGDRCAIALVGLDRNQCERGQLLCEPGLARVVDRFDVWLEVSDRVGLPLRSGTLVHVHAQTQESMATLAVLGGESLSGGQAGWVQLVLHRPIQVCTQDRIILRNASASQTLGGGTVGDVSAPKRNRQTPQRLSYLNTQLQKDVLARWVDGLEHLPFGLRVPERLLDAGIDPETPLSSLLNRAPQSTLQKMKSVHVNADQSWLISERVLKALEHKVLELLMQFHKEHPDVLGIFQDRARKALGSQLSELIWAELLKLWLQDKKVGLKRGFLFLTQHGQSLQEADQRMAQKALPLIHDGGFEPPWVRDLALSLNVNEVQMRMSLLRLSSQGELYQIVKDLFYHPVHVQDLAQRVRDCALRSALEHGHEGVSAAQFRDACGLGRKRAIQILEFFDKIGFCRRVGDAHVVRAGTSLFSEPIA